MRTELVVPMIPLEVREGLVLPASHLSVAFTRTKRDELDDEDGPKASGVEVRFDTRGIRDSLPHIARRIVAYHPLRADKRGTVRASCDEWPSRAQNLRGARVRLIELVIEALDDAPAPAPAPKRTRRPAGLVKAADRKHAPRRRPRRPPSADRPAAAVAPVAADPAVAASQLADTPAPIGGAPAVVTAEPTTPTNTANAAVPSKPSGDTQD